MALSFRFLPRLGALSGLAAISVATACDNDEAAQVTPFAIDPAAIAVAATDFDNGDLIRISREPVVSQHSGDSVQVWVSKASESAYREVDPSVPTAGELPVGTVIVKEQRKSDGTLDVLTVMVKGPPGYAPATRDWHWQRVTPDGTITHQGQVDFCINCHTPRAGADWVFGVPTSRQTP
jgi:hypothetical protein